MNSVYTVVFVLWVYLVLFFGDYNKYLRDYIHEFLSVGLRSFFSHFPPICIIIGHRMPISIFISFTFYNPKHSDELELETE